MWVSGGYVFAVYAGCSGSLELGWFGDSLGRWFGVGLRDFRRLWLAQDA